MMKYLTGDYRFRNEGDLLVLQVEETTYDDRFYGSSSEKTVWRDAKTEDLLNVRFCKDRDIKFNDPVENIYK